MSRTKRPLTVFLWLVLAGADSPALAQQPARIAELVKQLKDADGDVRMEAATALGRLRAEAKGAVPDLMATLKDPVPAVRMKAVDALGQIGPDSAAAVPALTGMLKDPEPLVRTSAAYALPRVGAEGKAAVPGLKESLKDPDAAVRRAAAVSLVGFGAEREAALPVLREGLRDENLLLRVQACRVLARVTPREEAAKLVPVLVDVLQQPDRAARREAVSALPSLGAKAVPVLVALVENGNEDAGIRSAALRGLARLGPAAKDAIPALQRMVALGGRWGVAAAAALKKIEASAAGENP